MSELRSSSKRSVSGWIVPAGDVGILTDRLRWCVEHPQLSGKWPRPREAMVNVAAGIAIAGRWRRRSTVIWFRQSPGPPDMQEASHPADPGALRIGWLASHPIQYHAPIYRELARRCDLTVFFAHRQTPAGQAAAGFGVQFDWDVDVLGGFPSVFLENRARQPGSHHFLGCNTPAIGEEIRRGRFDAFVVSGWSLLSYWQAVLACRRLGVPVLIRGDSQLAMRRSLAVRSAKRLVYPLLLKAFNAFLYVGVRNREYLRYYGTRRNVSSSRRTASTPTCSPPRPAPSTGYDAPIDRPASPTGP